MLKTFICEIGTEELPAHDLYGALEQFESLWKEGLKTARLSYDQLRVCATPRRLAVMVEAVAESTESLRQKMRGPAAAIAFKEDGTPTPAAIGFAKGKGLSVEDLFIEEEDGKRYVCCELVHEARSAQEVLSELSSIITSQLAWPKSQRWGSGQERFARPVRWICSLFGDELIPCSFGEINSDRYTRGHRFLAPGLHKLDHAENYESFLESLYVVLDGKVRAQRIKEGIAALEAETGLVASIPESTFKEVVNLVEWPQALLAHFDEEFLQVPQEIITDAMLEHQRYFPLYEAQGKLTNAFIVTSNGNPSCAATIIDGNERVVRARLSDAAFFYHEDAKRPLESYLEGLKRLGFQEKLGTVYQKAQRMSELAEYLAAQATSDVGLIAASQRAGLLAKADLVTNAVVEFTSLQGVMGGYYAELSGEEQAVSAAITEHYRPRFAQDELPASFVGRMVALADKLNTVVGIFAAGLAPTGSSDPYATRRSSLGIIRILQEETAISLVEVLEFALAQYQEQLQFDKAAVLEELAQFFIVRMEVQAKELGFAHDSIMAVSEASRSVLLNPDDFFARIAALDEGRAENPELFCDLATAYNRAHNLRDDVLGLQYRSDLLSSVEQDLAGAIETASTVVAASLAEKNYPQAVDALAQLKLPIDRFFDEVLVLDPDEELKNNRLKLLNNFVKVFEKLADISQLAKKK